MSVDFAVEVSSIVAILWHIEEQLNKFVSMQ